MDCSHFKSIFFDSEGWDYKCKDCNFFLSDTVVKQCLRRDYGDHEWWVEWRKLEISKKGKGGKEVKIKWSV